MTRDWIPPDTMTDPDERRAWVNDHDWTAKDGVSNTSDEMRRLIAEVERLIRGEAFHLIAGRADQTAGLIVAQLAHKHGVAPIAWAEERGYRRAITRLREAAEEYTFETGADHPYKAAASYLEASADEY